MGPEGWVLIIGAAGLQVNSWIQSARSNKSIGTKNGTGSVQEGIASLTVQLDEFRTEVHHRLDTLENVKI